MKTNASDKTFRLLAIAILAAALAAWLVFSEDGWAERFGTIGFAFCHQIPARTPQFPFGACPLCFRCSGLFLGTFIFTIILIRTEFTARELKRPCVIAACILSFGIYVFDGMKTFGIFHWMASLYPDLAEIRYGTGYMMGFTIGALVAVMWREVMIDPSYFVYAKFNKRERWIIPISGFFGAFLLFNRAPFILPFQIVFTALVGIAPFLLSGTLFAILISAFDTLIHANKKPRLSLRTRLLFGFALAAVFICVMVILRYQLSGGWVRTLQVNNTVN